MNQQKKKPVAVAPAAAAVATPTRTPYTATRDGKDRSVNGAAADGFTQALDRRVTEGFNLVHGRLDVIQEDVRENRRDIKEFRKELWDGLRGADIDRGRLAEKSELATLRAEMNERFTALEASQRDLRAEMNERFGTLEASQRDLRAEMNERFGTLEASQRELIRKVSTVLERSTAVAWTRRRIAVGILVGIGAGTGLLVIGAIMRPLLERVVAALIGG